MRIEAMASPHPCFFYAMTVSIVIHDSPLNQVVTAVGCIMRSEAVSRIYILDNGTTPPPPDVIGDKRIVYRRIPNDGFGAGHNIAMREAIRENPDGFHLVMNADVSWSGDALTPLLSYIVDNPEVGMVQPRMVYADGMLQYACRLLPTPLDLFAKRFLPPAVRRRRMERYLLAGHDHRRPLNVPYMQGSFMLIRNRALLECGLFDERFFMYPEDIDLTRRIHEKWQTLFLPEVEICHLHTAESRRSPRLFGIHIVNMIRYFNKWGWLFDKRRGEVNRQVEREIIAPPAGEREEGRG